MNLKTAISRLKDARIVLASSLDFTGRSVDRPVAGSQLRPDLNGLLLTMPGQKRNLYLVDGGYRRWLRDEPVLRRLFGEEAKTVESAVAVEIPLGTPIYEDARLVKSKGSDTIYLIDYDPNGTVLRNRPVAPVAFSAFLFRREAVQTIAPAVLRALETGVPVEGPQFPDRR